MNKAKKLVVSTVWFLMLLFFLSGCNLFSEGKKLLNLYCPGLKVNIAGVSYSANGVRDVYALSYDHSFQKQVHDYFSKKENSFSEKGDDDLFDVEIGDDAIIDKNDNILCKTIEKNKGKVEVVFNETTRRIIIIEYSEK